MSRVLFYFLMALLLAISALLSVALDFGYSFCFSLFCMFSISIYALIKNGLFSPVTVLVLTAIPYLTSAPTDIYLFDEGHHFYKSYMSWLVVSGAAFLLSFMVVYDFSKEVRLNIFVVEEKVNVKIMGILYFIFYLIYLFIVAHYFSLSIGSLSRADIYANKPTFFDVYKLFLYSFTIGVFWYIFVVGKERIFYSKLALLTLILLILTDTLILGDRKMALILILAVTFFYGIYNRIPKSTLIGFVILGFGFWILGFVRNLSLDQWSGAYSSLDFSNSADPANVEFGAFPIIWQDYFSKSIFEPKPTYLEAIVQLIPSFIYPDRPAPPSVDFVAKFYPAIHAAGGGFAFNAILESIMNFYWLGPFIVGGGLGYIFRFYNEKSRLGVLAGGMLIYTFAFMMRNDMVSMLRSSVFCAIVLLSFLMIFCKFSYRKLSI